MSKALKKAWGIPLLGCIPDRPYLGCPALADMERLFKAELISGHEHRFRHYNVRDMNVVTTSLTRYVLTNITNCTLYVASYCTWAVCVCLLHDSCRRYCICMYGV